MRAPILVIIPLVLFVSGSYVLKALHPPTPKLAEEMSAAEAWLGLDCMNNELERSLVRNLRQDAKAAEAYFINIIEEGLPKDAVGAAEEDYARFFEYRQQFLKNRERKITVVTGKESKPWAAPKMDRDDYMSAKLEAFQIAMQARSMEGLAALQTPSAKEYLYKLAENNRFELQAYAKELLN